MFTQIHYVRGMETAWKDGKPPHHFAPDGSWVSDVAGVNPDGSVEPGRDPDTGSYAPGDSYIGNRPVYYNETGLFGFGFRPYMDPDGFTGPRSNFERGFGGNNGSVKVEAPVAAPVTAPVVVFTPKPVLPLVVEGDNGSRAATFSADDVAKAHAMNTPSPVFTLPKAFIPPKFDLPAVTLDPSKARFLVDGTLTDGNGTVLNANRPADLVKPMTGDAAGTVKNVGGNGPQLLPTSNTTATRQNDYAAMLKKYAPYLLAVLVLLFVLHHMTKKAQ